MQFYLKLVSFTLEMFEKIMGLALADLKKEGFESQIKVLLFGFL